MVREADRFHGRIAEVFGKKANEPYSIIGSWIGQKILFLVISSKMIFVKASRSMKYEPALAEIINWEIAAKTEMKYNKLLQSWALLYVKNIKCYQVL